MAKNEGLMLLLVLIVGLIAYKKGWLNNLLGPSVPAPTPSPAPTTPPSGGGGPQPSGQPDENGVKLIYATTGNYVDMNVGGDPAGNGQRYNVNHSYQNYMSIGYYKIGDGQQAINHKTDGPNHDCDSPEPDCFWIEPQLELGSGQAVLNAEYPHPDGHDNLSCPSCKSVGGISAGQWLGWAVVAYGQGADRTVEAWVDTGGLINDTTPANQWQQVLMEKYANAVSGFIDITNRSLPSSMEAEIRMHGESRGHGNAGGTDMKYGRVYEIVAPGTPATTSVRAFVPAMAKVAMEANLNPIQNHPLYLSRRPAGWFQYT